MTIDKFTSLEDIQRYLKHFAQLRDWEKYHAPKNLCMALAVEAAELMEIFQWLPESIKPELDQQQQQNVRAEMADILLYLVRLADVLDIDLLEAAQAKAATNEQRYPAERVKGSAKKYSHYEIKQ